MSSLLLSQSIISSTENSLREKSLQQRKNHHHHPHSHHLNIHNLSRYNSSNYNKNNDSSSLNRYYNRSRLIVTDTNENYNRSSIDDYSKFCWLIFISVLVLIFYLLVFSLISFICYVLFIWIPSDIERNKLNNELYDSMINERHNILLIGQLPQYDRKIIITKNLYIFESRQNEDLMNFATKPILLQNKYPALYWNENFQTSILNKQISGAIWLDESGNIVFVFISPKNETAINLLRFQPLINHISNEIIIKNINETIIPISTIDQGVELKLIQMKNKKSIKILYNNDNDNRYLCLNNINNTIKNINLNENICTTINNTIDWPIFYTGFGNGTSLHLFTYEMEKKQKVLIVPEKILYRIGIEYQTEFIELSQLLSNRLFPLIGDFIIIAIASTILFIMIILILKFMIKKRNYNDNNRNDINHHNLKQSTSSTIMEETRPLLKNKNDDKHSNGNKWTNIFCWSCTSSSSNSRKTSNNNNNSNNDNNNDKILTNHRNIESNKQNTKNYTKI